MLNQSKRYRIVMSQRLSFLLLVFLSFCFVDNLSSSPLKKTLEAYLNQLTTLEAEFQQTDAAQQSSTGRLYLSRPGKIRFEFLNPELKLLVSDGTWLIFYDAALQEVTYMDIKDTPAKFLLSDQISFDNELTLKEVQELEDTYVASLEASKEGYHFILYFLKDPLTLKGWTIRDSQGQETHLTLFNHKLNPPIAEEKFKFKDPRSRRKD